MNKKLLLIGSVLFVTAIILGAFGAHALKELLSAEKLESFEVGVRYQFYTSMILLLFGLTADKFSFSLRSFYLFQILGVFLFSGSIYFLSLEEIFHTSLNFLGPITPVGGGLMIIGWVLFIFRLWRIK
jgi:uncharacterized membrane protein YgdD (TMEM256/DUF423 family)